MNLVSLSSLAPVLLAAPSTGLGGRTLAADGRSIALFPVQDRVGDSAAAAAIDLALRGELGRLGRLVGPGETRDALRRLRIRNGDRVAPLLLRRLGAELRADWLASATLHETDRSLVPGLTLSVRLYSTAHGGAPLDGLPRARAASIGGRVLGLGTIAEVEELAPLVARDLLRELPRAAGGAGAAVPREGASGAGSAPSPSSRSRDRRPGSPRSSAEAVTEAAQARLFADGVRLVSPNRLHDVLRRLQGGQWGGVTAETRAALARTAAADTILTGAVEAYDLGGGDGEPEPVVAIGLRLLEVVDRPDPLDGLRGAPRLGPPGPLPPGPHPLAGRPGLTGARGPRPPSRPGRRAGRPPNRRTTMTTRSLLAVSLCLGPVLFGGRAPALAGRARASSARRTRARRRGDGERRARLPGGPEAPPGAGAQRRRRGPPEQARPGPADVPARERHAPGPGGSRDGDGRGGSHPRPRGGSAREPGDRPPREGGDHEPGRGHGRGDPAGVRDGVPEDHLPDPHRPRAGEGGGCCGERSRRGRTSPHVAKESSVDPYGPKGGLVENLARIDTPHELAADRCSPSSPGALEGPVVTRIGYSVVRVESFVRRRPRAARGAEAVAADPGAAPQGGRPPRRPRHAPPRRAQDRDRRGRAGGDRRPSGCPTGG